MIKRSQYMQNSSELFQDYYSQFVTEATKRFVLREIGLQKLLQSKDGHFNDIGIKYSQNGLGPWIWDFAPYNMEAMREAEEVSKGYLPSPATVTCTAKACARMLVEAEWSSDAVKAHIKTFTA